jgi:putative intracellular protease/amidase
MAKILMVLSAAVQLPLANGEKCPTGFWAQEFVEPYHIFHDQGWEVDIATPGGQPARLDTTCLQPQLHGNDPERSRRLKEQLDQIAGWQNPLSLERMAAEGTRYQAVFFPGGYAPMVDLCQSEAAGSIIVRNLRTGGLIGAVCHGQAALLAAGAHDKWQFSNYSMTCFSPAEERLAGFAGKLHFALVDALEKRGATLSYADAGTCHIVVDRQLYTGQNPASVGKLVHRMTEDLNR